MDTSDCDGDMTLDLIGHWSVCALQDYYKQRGYPGTGIQMIYFTD